MEKVIVVDGYSFMDENMAKQALTEAEGVKYARARTDMSKPEQVFHVYQQLLDQKMFQTQIGYAYLKELQEYLKTMPGIHSEDIMPIPVASNLVIEDIAGNTAFWRGRLEREQRKLRVSLVANLIFVLAIIAMFVISASGGQTTILNYEKSLQDRYAQWEQELTQREEAVRAKERELAIDADTFLDEE